MHSGKPVAGTSNRMCLKAHGLEWFDPSTSMCPKEQHIKAFSRTSVILKGMKRKICHVILQVTDCSLHIESVY